MSDLETSQRGGLGPSLAVAPYKKKHEFFIIVIFVCLEYVITCMFICHTCEGIYPTFHEEIFPHFLTTMRKVPSPRPCA